MYRFTFLRFETKKKSCVVYLQFIAAHLQADIVFIYFVQLVLDELESDVSTRLCIT